MIPADVIERCARAAYEVDNPDCRYPADIGENRYTAIACAVLEAAHTDLEREVIEACVVERQMEHAFDVVSAAPCDGETLRSAVYAWDAAKDDRDKAAAALLAAREKTGGAR